MTIVSFDYAPQKLTVQLGDTVVWVNNDLVPHTVTAQGRAFDSGEIAPRRSWSWKASERGAYPYLCSYHPTMKATLVVE